MNKTESLIFRVTPVEKEKLKARARELGYDNLSRFILDAAMGEIAPCSSAIKLSLLTQWHEMYLKNKTEFSRLGSNINQMAKYENTLQYSGVLNSHVIEENIRLKKELSEFLSAMKSFNDKILVELKKIR